jgi:methionine synthase II (cobalamin-independent)
MNSTNFNCLPTHIGSVPHNDPAKACAAITRCLPDLPAWPQLPRLSPLENMDAQYAGGFPGAVFKDGSVRIDQCQDIDGQLTVLYQAYLDNNTEQYPISRERAAGLHYFLDNYSGMPQAVKGQLTGPVTWGLSVTDIDGKSIIYDDVLGDAVPRFLKLQASWQEQQLRELGPRTIVFVDEPILSSFGSVGLMLSREQVITAMNEVFSGINGLKGCHCCGNTDWSLLTDTKVDIISFDAYNFAASLALYPDDIKAFIGRGGAVAWGIVPTDDESLSRENAATLKDRLEEAIAPFTRLDIPYETLKAQALLTPSCGLATLSSDAAAEAALELLAEVSRLMRA